MASHIENGQSPWTIFIKYLFPVGFALAAFFLVLIAALFRPGSLKVQGHSA